MEYVKLEHKIDTKLIPYFDGVDSMSMQELEDLRESVKQTRKQKFRFTNTEDIDKIRIQLALSKLAKLFRLINDKINNTAKNSHLSES